MAGSLKSRLARLKGLGLVKAAELAPGRGGEGKPLSGAGGKGVSSEAEKPAARPRPGFLEGWTEISPFVYRRELLYDDPLPPEFDPRPFIGLGKRRGGASPGSPDSLGSLDSAAGPSVAGSSLLSSASLRLFDLETTGLSGGTGTIAFLAAVGRIGAEGLVISQLFLADYPGERDFVAALLAELGDSPCLVSYNGRAFDLPLLRTRCVMCALLPPEPRLHLDALFPARRLWRRIHGGASLGLLEKAVLGRERESDVPGSLVPEVYFEYLKTGDHPLMPGVLSHNAEDVASLARLLGREERIFAEPRKRAATERIDLGGLGRFLLALGREEEAEEILEAAAGEGDGASGLLLARRRRRSGLPAEAREALGLVSACYEKSVEESRIAERLDRDLPQALAAAHAALALARGPEELEEAERRVGRLERSLMRRRKGPRPE